MQQVSHKLPFKLIYSLGEHPYLGYIIEPHIVQLNSNGSYSMSSKRIFTNTIGDFASGLTESDFRLIALLDEIEQTHIIKSFTQKAIRPLDFFGKIFDEKTYERIRPKIEQILLQVLPELKGKPLFLMSKDGYPTEQEIHIAEEPMSILFHFRRNESETRYFPTLKYQGSRLDFMYKGAQVIIHKQAWLLLENTLYYFDQALDGKKLSPFLNKRFISVARNTEKRYFESFVSGLIEKYAVYAEGFSIKTERFEAIPRLKLVYIPDGQSYIELAFQYGDYEFTGEAEQPVSVVLSHEEANDSYTFHRIKRAQHWEKKQAAFLESQGLHQKVSLFAQYVSCKKGLSTVDWLNEQRDKLVEKGFQIRQAAGERRLFIGKSSLEMAINEGNDWFDVRAIAHFGPYQIPFMELREHILNKTKEFTLPNGEIALIPDEWFAQYEQLFIFSKSKQQLQLHKSHMGLLYELSAHTEQAFHRKLERLINFESMPDVPVPTGFRGDLRPYQLAGYHWFHFLQSYKFGGCLADDMGLGKTVQTLALLQQQKVALKGSQEAKTSLLILPTSLLYNWQKEAEKFAPDLRLHIHTGSHRLKDSFGFSHFDLIISTYGIVRSDAELFGNYFFNYIVLDESQQIKNPSSKAFKAIKGLKSKHKLALSGTPIENSVADIWSQMHFANPGLLGSYSYFQKEFVLPIEKKKDEEKAARLQAIIKPFVLRRTKNQVATELPPKTEQVIFCEMSEEQAKQYESTKSEYRNALLENELQQQASGKQIMLLQGLTKLRQLANHPSMLPDAEPDLSSGKFDAVIERLGSILAEKHKVLIFSQFVKHLQLFRSYFDQKQLPYAYLDGQTKDRAEAVNHFKGQEDIQLFLISIKAGGVGLNLTEADYVFILDPWWNPAVEQQAIDRSHRIGQTKNVFIYKFISKDTVEEKILALQNQKKALSSALITTEESFIKSLSQADIQELLQ